MVKTIYKLDLTGGQALTIALVGLFFPFLGWALGPLAIVAAWGALKKNSQSQGKAYAALVLGVVDIAVPWLIIYLWIA